MLRMSFALSLLVILSACGTRFQATSNENPGGSAESALLDGAGGTVTQPGGGGAGGSVGQGGGQGLGGTIGQPPSGTAGGNVTTTTIPTTPPTLGGICPTEANQFSSLGYDQTTFLTVVGTPVVELLAVDPANNFSVVCDTTTGIHDQLVSKTVDLDAACPGLLTKNLYGLVLKDPTKDVPLYILSFQTTTLPQNSTDDVGHNPAFHYVYRGSNSSSWQFAIGIQSSSLSLQASVQKMQTFINTDADPFSHWDIVEIDKVIANPGDNLLQVTVPGVSYAVYTNNLPKYLVYDQHGQSGCDISNYAADPLMIDLSPADEVSGEPNLHDSLTSVAEGVLFDLLGLNSPLGAHEKILTAWVKNPNFAFIALPLDGRVNGIDQLFGNNTAGRDGQFATDGFAALAKYDSNGDGIIDPQDPVFSQLRLWQDKNFDGISQANELISLAQAGVQSISLKYNPSFSEVDAHGNSAKFKSTAQTSRGSRLVFDLWLQTRDAQ